MATDMFGGIAAGAAPPAVLRRMCAAGGGAKQRFDHKLGTTTTVASGVPFDLFHHCGIDEARVQDTFFAAEQPLDDGNGNPPAGWGNPTSRALSLWRAKAPSSTTAATP